ncbi:MAG: hypothetical protein JNM25_06990 [Planctomycetes bacterium]|nr:hypothetical protein [Planctomycetota bacterium]
MAGPPNARARASLLLAACGLAPLAAQRPVDAGDVERTLRRASDDTHTACRDLLEQPVAFTGSCRFVAGRAFPDDDEPIAFRGAWQQGLALLELGQHTVLTHGPHQVVRTEGGAWTPPQGDAPDLPFSPRTLAQHVAAAHLDAAEPVFLDGRPAMRVHAVWAGAAAAALLQDCYHPHSQAQQVLERLPKIVQAQTPERVCVDAAVCFDPATRTLRSLVLRAALLDGNELRDGDEPPPAPEGLPVLPRARLLEYTFVIQVVPLAEVPLPELDADLRQRLAWPPPAAPPAPTPAPRPVR